MSLKLSEVFHNIIVGLAVSIVMLNLGAALGILSERGAFAGMLSAGIIAVVTSALGGTRIQGSGTTAPMSTVTAVIVAYAVDQLPNNVAGVSADHFVNIVLMMTAGILVFAGILRLGRFIKYVPNLVISGFMCGIALIIWVLQFELLFGVGRDPIEGPMHLNLAIALATLFIAFVSPYLISKFSKKCSQFLPGTLVALISVSILAFIFELPVAYLDVGTTIKSFSDFSALVASQVPSNVTLDVLFLAFPFALKLAALCYIDTLLTSLIVDKMKGEKSRQNKELIAQGGATALVSIIGGVPGAQSTVPSVLTIKEGATLRLAGICAGLFVIVELFLFADLMSYIPQAVFAGILIKVGYDVFDFKPLYAYMRTVKRNFQNRSTKVVSHKEMTVLSGTALVTAFIDLIIAVGVFTLGFHAMNRYMQRRTKIRDFVPN